MGYKGVQNWTSEEFEEKTDALSKAKRSIVSVVKGKLADEFVLSAPDYRSETAPLAFQTAAVNAVLAWLNFPTKLRSFVDCIVALAGETGAKSFTATNLEIGKQIRIGRKAKDDSIQKSISRLKSQVIEWQNNLSFDIIGIERGRFNPEKRKNEPTTYTPYLLEWIPEIIALASETPNWQKGIRLKLKEIRRSARDVLNSLPTAPPIRGYEPKTLSEEEKFDRRHHIILSSMIKNRELLNSMGFVPEEYFRFLVGEMDKIATNPSGAANILTPPSDEVNLKSSIWNKIKAGELCTAILENDEHLETKLETLEAAGFNRVSYAVEAMESEEPRNIITPRVWEDGKFRETSNEIQTKTAEISTGQILNSASDNLQNTENRACKSLIPLTHDRTFSGIIDGTISDDEIDFSDWQTEAEGVAEMTHEKLAEIVQNWYAEIKIKVPQKQPKELWNGGWQIYWGELFDSRSKQAEANLKETVDDVVGGTKTIADLRGAVLDWIMSHLYYYKEGVSILPSKQTLKEFRERLDNFLLTLPSG